MVKKYYIKSSASALKSEIDRIRDQLAYLEATRQEAKIPTRHQPNAEVLPTRPQTVEAVREPNVRQANTRQQNTDEVILREPNGRRSRSKKTAVYSPPIELETKVVELNFEDEPKA